MAVSVKREARAEGGFVARVTIDRAAKLNALDRVLIGEIIDAVTGFAEDLALRLAVVTGAGGRAFIGGADIDELAALDADSARGFITAVHVCCDAFRHLPVPAIARIDGYALGEIAKQHHLPLGTIKGRARFAVLVPGGNLRDLPHQAQVGPRRHGAQHCARALGGGRGFHPVLPGSSPHRRAGADL